MDSAVMVEEQELDKGRKEYSKHTGLPEKFDLTDDMVDRLARAYRHIEQAIAEREKGNIE